VVVEAQLAEVLEAKVDLALEIQAEAGQESEVEPPEAAVPGAGLPEAWET
jgi:hypothetical protein